MFLKFVALTLILTVFFKSGYSQRPDKPFHSTTVWTFLPSIKYDAFCLLNTLMGDDFYIKYYPRIYKHYDSLFTTEARKSLSDLRQYKNKRGMILSAFLCNIFYQLPDSSLTEIVAIIKDKSKIKMLLTPGNFSVYTDIRKDLITVFEFLIENEFEKKYDRDIIPLVVKRIDTLLPIVKKYNIVNNIEKTVGLPLATDTIKFYLVRYSKPHGISINNTIFLSDISYDLKVTMQVAIHEMMHPYFNTWTDEFKNAINTLKKDSFIYNAFLTHDKSFGYNDFEGFISESCVRALEQEISKQFGLGIGENDHWKTDDKGMHVFGAILIYEMKTRNFPEHFAGNFMDLLLQTIEDVNKLGGKYLFNQLYYSSLKN